MVDKADLRNMIMTFRVSELQLLLGLTSQSRYGRKTELLQRALALVENGVSLPIQLKIRELYQKFTPRVPGCNPAFSIPQNTASRSTINVNTGTIHKGLCELLNQNGQTMTTTATYPEVKFKHLPFYDLLGEILRPVSLVPRSTTKQQETRISFSLNDQQIQEITMSRSGFSSNKLEYNVQVQLRFCLVDSTTRQPDAFPSNITVKVNGVLAALPNPIPTNKPGAQAKRPSRPVDITTLCRFSNSINNSINISWMTEENKTYCLAVYLVKRLDSSILLQRLKRSGACKPEQTKMMIREKLSLDRDAELATTSLRISLRCPLGKVRMKLPCRAATCNHLQCFDAETFLQMNEKKPSWICPICDRPADFSKLILDGLFLEIVHNSPDSTEIELTKDGLWHITGTEDVDENSCGSPRAEAHEMPGNGRPFDGDVIDLTESDDEAAYQYDSKTHLQGLTKTYLPSIQSKCSTVSSPAVSSPQVTVYDLSPLNFPVPSPPLLNLSPDLVSDLSPPLPPPPLAHRNYQPFTLSSKLNNIPPAAPPVLPPPAFGGFPSIPGGLHAPYGLYGGRFDGLMPNDVNMMDLFSLMSSFPDYSLAANQQLALSNGFFDYLYPSRADSTLDVSGQHSPNS